MKRRAKLVSQPRIGARRKAMSTLVERRIERAIERDMAIYGVSRSFVLAVNNAAVYGIDLGDGLDFRKWPRLKTRWGPGHVIPPTSA